MPPLLYCNRVRRCPSAWLWMASLALITAAAHADELHVSLDARVVIIEADGSRRASPDQRARPGDLIEYQAAYRNDSGRALTQVQATVPIPAGTDLDATQALPPLASRDGQKFEPTPLRAPRQQADGSMRPAQALPLSVYRYLRWPLGELSPGQTRVLRVLVKVRQAEPASSTSSILNEALPKPKGSRS